MSGAICCGPSSDRPSVDATSSGIFTDRAVDVGLDFVHINGRSGERYFTEITGSGGALFDYDGDGDLDVYLVQGAPLGDTIAAPSDGDVPPPPGIACTETN